MSEIFGFIFEKETSYNATGRIYPRDEQGNKKKGKKRIIIAGHIDSAFQMKITKHGDKVYKYALPGFLFIILQVLFGTIKTIWGGLGDPTTYVKGYGFSLILLDFIFLGIALFGIPSFLYLVNGLVGGTPVEGANDNLSGVGIALSLAEYFSREENRLKHVELWLGGFGSEECGERGAQHFVEKYGRKGLLDNAYNVIPESCGAGDRLAIITKEPIHLAHHDIELCKKVYKGYERFVRETKSGDPIPCKIQKLPFSASDAGRFSLAGYKATMVIAFEGALAKPKNWHHEDDLPENLDYKMMRTVFGTYKNFIINTDKLENI